MTKANIFIIDDEKLDRYLFRHDLKKTGIDVNVVEFSGGLDALAFLEDFEAHQGNGNDGFPPEIIFLDINMPRLSGFGFLERFALLQEKHGDYGRCAVIVMSSSEHPDERERALGHPAVAGFITKGKKNTAELGTKISELLETVRSSGA